jgi:hypothetical protein
MKKGYRVILPLLAVITTISTCFFTACSGTTVPEQTAVSHETASPGLPGLTATAEEPITPQPSPGVHVTGTIAGDVNQDGVVNMADAIKLERMILGIEPSTVEADFNGDGVLNMGDLIGIERLILGQK